MQKNGQKKTRDHPEYQKTNKVKPTHSEAASTSLWTMARTQGDNANSRPGVRVCVQESRIKEQDTANSKSREKENRCKKRKRR